jgi:hypothetical protein
MLLSKEIKQEQIHLTGAHQTNDDNWLRLQYQFTKKTTVCWTVHSAQS